MLNPRLKDEGSNAVRNDDRVVVLSRNGKDEVVAVVPSCQILPVTFVSIDSDIVLHQDQQRTGEAYRISHLSGVRIHKYDGNLLVKDCTCC